LTSGKNYVLVLFMHGSHPVIHVPVIHVPVIHVKEALRPEAEERRARHLRILAELADIGMELVQQVKRQALGKDASVRADPVLAFARLAKAVRQTVALEARLADGFAPCKPVVPRGDVAIRSAAGPLKARVQRSVEAAIASRSDGDAAEALLLDMHEQLDDPEFEDELAEWPIGVVVASICRALRVKFDSTHFSDAEMGLDPEAMKAPASTRFRPPLDVVAVAGADGQGDETGLPVWTPGFGTAVEPPPVSRPATGLPERRSETTTRFSGRPKPYD
jgi:hypothetical protein